MAGRYPRPKTDIASGVLILTANTLPDDAESWKREVELFFAHLHHVMGFAIAHHIKFPVQDYWTEGQWERTVFSQSKSRRNSQHVFHPMTLQKIFDAAVAAYFAPPIVAKNFAYALEWFAMEATYNELRLMHVFTAIENLVDSNLSEDEKVYLPAKTFRRVSKSLRRCATESLAPSPAGDAGATDAASVAFLEAIAGKMLDLNRRSFQEKMLALAARWGVPLFDLPMDKFARAVTARNGIVHRGYYYEPEPDSPAERDLWNHVSLVREVVIRFVLTILGFEGVYLSFRGGQHDVIFPPSPAKSPAPASDVPPA